MREPDHRAGGRPGAPVENLIEGGCKAVEDDASVLIDPFGLRWAVEPRPESTHAVVNPI